MTADDATSLSDRIRGILFAELQWDGSRADLTNDLPLIENHVVDSLGLLRLVTTIESEFGIEIRGEDVVVANFGSIARIAAFVQEVRDRP